MSEEPLLRGPRRASEPAETRGEPRLAAEPGSVARLRFGSFEVDAELRDRSESGLGLALPANAARSLTLEVGTAFELYPSESGGEPRRASLAWVRRGPEGALTAGALLAPEPLLPREGELVDLERTKVDPAWALRLPAAVAFRRLALPLCRIGERVLVACADPRDARSLALVERHLERPIVACASDPMQLQRALRRLHGEPRAAAEAATDEPVAVCDELFHAAAIRQASDIHVCPERDGVHVRLRVDGVLEPYRVLPQRTHAELLSRIKVLAGMDIAERRAPQDGRILHALQNGSELNVRVATLPTPHGERATLRLLGIHTEALTLPSLGLREADLRAIERALGRSHGLVLATGPTGSGKTTTLYAALRRIVTRRSVNAITVQEPIEYEAPGITHVEIDPSQKLTIPEALRSILRHDPDVILVGEIRDRETADLAIKAALTGHLVLATLHTNSATSAVTRLVDMGVPSYLVAATLRTVVAQRLVRRLCPECSSARPVPGAILRNLGLQEEQEQHVREPRGCVYCAGRGYAGRSGLFEVLELDEELAERVGEGLSERALLTEARERGMRMLREDALSKLLDGTTSLAELRVALGT